MAFYRGMSGGFALTAAILMAFALPSAGEDVDTLIKRGNDLRRKGRDRDALAEFQKAARINETSRVTAQIALAEQALGLWVEAESHLNKALGHERDPWIVKNRAILESALATIKTHVGTLEVWGSPDGAEVMIDDKPVGQLPSVGPIALGSDHVALQVRAPGYVELTRTLTITLGSATREHVDLRRLPPPPAKVAVTPAPVPAESSRTPMPEAQATGRQTPDAREVPASSVAHGNPVVLGTAGLAAGALAFAIVEHVAWRNKVASFGTMTCDADLPDRGGATCGHLYQDGTRARNLAFIGYGLAGALATTSLVLYLTRPEPTSGNGTHLACAVSPLPGSVQCALRF